MVHIIRYYGTALSILPTTWTIGANMGRLVNEVVGCIDEIYVIAFHFHYFNGVHV